MRRGGTVWIWLAAVVALVALFNFYPNLANFPAALVAVPAIALLIYRFSNARKEGTLALHSRVIGSLTALHFLAVSAVIMVFVVVWPLVVLPHVRTDPNALTLFVAVPVIALIVAAAVALGIGLYFARVPRQ